MKKVYTSLLQISYLLFFSLITSASFSQWAGLPKNEFTSVAWVNGLNGVSGLEVKNISGVSGQANVIDANLNNSASGLLALGGTATVRVGHTGNAHEYPAGTRVGFNLAVPSVASSITLRAYHNGVVVATQVVDQSLVSLTRNNYLMTVNVPFHDVEVSVTVTVLGTVNVYHAIIQAYEAGPALVCNTSTVLTAPTHPLSTRVTTTGAGIVLNPNNAIDNDPGNGATMTIVLAGSAALSVRNHATVFSGPHHVGFDVTRNSVLTVDALGGMEVRTYLNGAVQETINSSNGLLTGGLLGSTNMRIGFVTNADFNEVELYINGVSVSLGDYTVSNFVVRELCSSDPLVCNTETILREPTHAVYVNSERTGATGLGCVNCTISNTNNLFDTDTDNYATMNVVAGLANSLSLSVKDAMSAYPAGTYAGFRVSSGSLAQLDLLGGMTITTYKDNTPVQTVPGTTLLSLGSSLISGQTVHSLGFIASGEFDEIVLTLQNVAGISLGETRVYGVFATELCDINTLDCNEQQNLSFPEYPVVINGERSGFGGIACAGCNFTGMDNVIDNDPATFATLTVPASVGTNATLSVYKGASDFPANTFIGFPIESASLLSVDLLNGITLRAYNNGVEVFSADMSSNTLLTVNSGIFFSPGTRIIGMVPDVAFDEAVIEFSYPISASITEIEIHDVVVQRFCTQPISCDETIYLNGGSTGMPVYVNYAETGVDGIACGLCGVSNAENVITENPADFATIQIPAGVLNVGKISVRDAINTYPAGTYAGFTIRNDAALAAAAILSSITIRTYLNGVPVESSTVGSLIDLELLGIPIFGTGTGIFNVGFQASQEFNEIQIEVRELTGVTTNVTYVYGAWVDTRASNGGTLYCHKHVSPDINVAIANIPITGNRATNDIMPAGSVYGTLIPFTDNPHTATTLISNPDGTYTFEASEVGVYMYESTVCTSSGSTCFHSVLKITVTPNSTDITGTFPVIVKPDVANVKATNTVSIPVTLNDAPGNDIYNLDLTTLSIAQAPANGIASVDGAGNILYTANPGFVGKDSLRYEISDDKPGTPHTGAAWVYVHVYPADYVNTVMANDDLAAGMYNIQGNILHNDHDPEGHNISVVNHGTHNITGGTLVLQPDGSFTFTPTTGFEGTTHFICEVTDDHTEPASAFSTLFIVANQSYTLPIHIESFEVSRNNQQVKLTWKTSLEENASHFVIERSTDGTHFTAIATVNAERKEQYEYFDVFTGSGTVYYRLKLVDQDASYTYSVIRNVVMTDNIQMNIYPNPVPDGNAYLHTGNYNGRIHVRVTDVMGRSLSVTNYQVTANSKVRLTNLRFNVPMVFVNVTDESGNILYKVQLVLK